jgi:SAM-dependent methyltransferase
MTPSVQRCYDGIAAEYHLMFTDWRAEVVRQGEVLDRLIRRQVGLAAHTVLDCACGIGTQAIGLAMRGYAVHATDLSPAAVARAAREAESFGVSLTCGVADFRAPATISRPLSAVPLMGPTVLNVMEWTHAYVTSWCYLAALGAMTTLQTQEAVQHASEDGRC